MLYKIQKSEHLIFTAAEAWNIVRVCLYGCVFTTIVITYLLICLFICWFICLATCINHLLSVFVFVWCMRLCLLIQKCRHKIELHCYYSNYQMTISVSVKVYGYTFRLMLDIRQPIQNIQVSFITSAGNFFFSFPVYVTHLNVCLQLWIISSCVKN